MESQVVLKKKSDIKWNTKLVNECIAAIEDGIDITHNPFAEGNPDLRAADIVFDYTPEEQEEIMRCSVDPVYFANKYCKLMTDDGIKNIDVRDYQKEILHTLHNENNRHTIMMCSRQVGKTTTTGIYIAHYLCFNRDRNVMVLANKSATTNEIIDKIKEILKGLPFFLKPGIKTNAIQQMKFDNGCRLIGQSTTKTAAIGYTIHLLFMDEFAHIQPSFINQFYRSVIPTISSSKVSKIVITSTPNGMNKFYDIWIAAIEKKNEYTPLRVDWWQVPGRDETWKEKEIATLGSEEMFNQEYGLQFLSSSNLLLDGNQLLTLKSIVEEYKWKTVSALEEYGVDYSKLIWHPKFEPENVEDWNRFVFTIDTAGGVGQDFTIVNIFKLIPKPIHVIEKIKSFDDEKAFFGLLQVGLFRCNRTSINDVAILLEALLFHWLNDDQSKVVLEMDFKGNLLLEKLGQNEDWFDEIMIYTKHTEKAKVTHPGIRLNRHNKPLYCFDLKKKVKEYDIIPNEHETFLEMSSFGLDHRRGNTSYSSQIGHDDIAMTLVNLTTYFETQEFSEQIEEIYDMIDEKYIEAIKKQFSEFEKHAITKDKEDFSLMQSLMDSSVYKNIEKDATEKPSKIAKLTTKEVQPKRNNDPFKVSSDPFKI